MEDSSTAQQEGITDVISTVPLSGDVSGDESGIMNLASQMHRQKLDRIHRACIVHDHAALRDLAASKGGLIEDAARRVAWPLLLGCTRLSSSGEWKSLGHHRDEEQVQLDVNRSFVYYPENESAKETESRKHELSDVITAVLRLHPMLCYFQGFHDIVQVFLLVLGAEAAEPAVARLSLLRIRDFMLPTLAGAESHLRLLPSILYATDAELYRHLSSAARPTPFFALAATLTLYAHDIEQYGEIARLFDFLLANDAAVPLYLYAAIIISRKAELLDIESHDSDMLHFTLSKLPKPLNLEDLIERTTILYAEHPPERLPNRAWSKISNISVLKTTRNPSALAKQNLQDGERMFARQAKEIEQQEMRRRLRRRMQLLMYSYRRPAKWTGAAVLVAVLALYLGRSDYSVPAIQGAVSTAIRLGQRVYDLSYSIVYGSR